MVTPITGPFSRNVTLKGAPIPGGFRPSTFNKSTTWWRQKVPFDRPLAFSMDMRNVEAFWDLRGPNNYREYTSAPSYDSSHFTLVDAKNKAYAKFVESIGEQSQWANNVLEMRRADRVIADGATALLKFSRAVRKLDATGAARALGLGKHSVALSSRNTFSQNWLRYHFGVEPMMKDIHAAVETFCADFGPKKTIGRASTKQPLAAWQTDTPSSTSYTWSTYNVKTSCRISADVRITNANLNLMKQLGVINPASIVWEAIPFSFVVDWFANVGQVLASVTDLYGVTLTNPQTTYLQTANSSVLWRRGLSGLTPPYRVGDPFMFESYSMAACRRSLALAGPTLAVKPFRGISPIRGATAIALLFNFLKR